MIDPSLKINTVQSGCPDVVGYNGSTNISEQNVAVTAVAELYCKRGPWTVTPTLIKVHEIGQN